MSSETLEKDSKQKLAALHAAGDDGARDDDAGEGDDGQRDEESKGSSSSRTVSEPSGEKVVLERPGGASMIWTVARREIASNFLSPITYIVTAVSFVVFGAWFFYHKGGFWQVDRASMVRAFDMVPAALCAILPLYTMRSLSDEKRIGTIELLITMPVKDSEVILGKFIGSMTVMTAQLGLLAIYPILMFKFPWHIGELDWNPFWVGMLGLFLLSAAGTAIGLMWSSYTDSQLLAYFAATITLATLYAFGQLAVVESLKGAVGDAFAFVSLQSRFEPFSRGIIDSRAIVYFLSITVLCLLVAFRSLESRKWS
jgi:ABC-2 type transport system permease protein